MTHHITSHQDITPHHVKDTIHLYNTLYHTPDHITPRHFTSHHTTSQDTIHLSYTQSISYHITHHTTSQDTIQLSYSQSISHHIIPRHIATLKNQYHIKSCHLAYLPPSNTLPRHTHYITSHHPSTYEAS